MKMAFDKKKIVKRKRNISLTEFEAHGIHTQTHTRKYNFLFFLLRGGGWLCIFSIK